MPTARFGLAGGGPSTSGCTVIRSSFAPCSPACKPTTLRIGSKWAELQGARDWDGLLSPLDGALRGELVRYGEFVRAAYASFDSSYGSNRFPSRSLLRRAGMPGTGYRVTRLLHAASTSAPGWLPLRRRRSVVPATSASSRCAATSATLSGSAAATL